MSEATAVVPGTVLIRPELVTVVGARVVRGSVMVAEWVWTPSKKLTTVKGFCWDRSQDRCRDG